MSQAKIGDMVIIAGTATKDAELKLVGSKNTPQCRFGLAVGKDKQDKTIFANCVAWRNLAQYAADNICKGDNVCVIGRLESREYNGKTYTDVVADWINVVGASSEATTAAPPQPFKSAFEESVLDADGELPF